MRQQPKRIDSEPYYYYYVLVLRVCIWRCWYTIVVVRLTYCTAASN